MVTATSESVKDGVVQTPAEQHIIRYQTLVLPSGLDPIRDADQIHLFGVYVRWAGEKGWLVTTSLSQQRLSRKGRQWAWYVEPRMKRFYYFPDYAEALEAAMEAVETMKVNGRTWAEWREWLNKSDPKEKK
jgi:hypothetical protein